MTNGGFQETQRIIELISAQVEGRLTIAEQKELDVWLTADPKNQELFKQLTDNNFREAVVSKWDPDAAERSLARVKARMHRKAFSWSRIAAAASILLFLSIGSYLYFNRQKPVKQIAYNQPVDIKPGGNKAILTLSNGSQISLTDAKKGKLAVQANTIIKKTADGKIAYESQNAATPAEMQYNTVTTPRGGRYEGTLADGTHFILDAASSIRFPVKFTGSERLVAITGQVYIKVKYDAGHPFRVSAKGQMLEDLGTEFNINAYDDEPNIRTTLIEGSVKVSKQQQSVVLIPGQQAVNDNQTIKVQKVNVNAVIAWKNGQTLFNGEDIHEIMRNVSRWYDVDIRYEAGIPNRQFAGSISRNANLSDLLNILEFDNVHFTVDGKTIIVKP
jgi:transmembrane sensor